jgi:hypothetical protein
MLQIPPIKASGPQPQQSDTAAPSKAAPAKQDNAFADVLDTVGSDMSPQELRAEVKQQVSDGVPLDEVLDNLVQKVEDESEQPLTAAMMPVLSAVVQEAAKPSQGAANAVDADLLLRLGSGKGGDAVASSDKLAEALRDLPGDGEADDGLPLEQLLGKEKAMLVGRLSLSESAGAVLQAPSLRSLELPLSHAGMQPGTASNLANDMLQLPPKVGEAGWGQALAQRVMWMVGREHQSAELRLNPAHLGPLEVKLSLHHDQASVSLLAHNGAVRDALEQALPRLRDMFNQQDIQLVQVDVGQREDPRGGQAAANPSGLHTAAAHPGAGAAGPVSEDEADAVVVTHSRGLLDAYA